MRAVICSGAQLPFADQSFDVAVVSDVMEHVPPIWREKVVSEALRVSRVGAVVGYPCGPAAFAADQKLREHYLKRGISPPVWLDEHMMYPFPDRALFSVIPSGWGVKAIPNESLGFHYGMMRMEMYRTLDYLCRLGLYLFPSLVEWLLCRVDQEPSYRTIFVVYRQ